AKLVKPLSLKAKSEFHKELKSIACSTCSSLTSREFTSSKTAWTTWE
ncbi:34396_t:CDS:2, partial [Gigaspora margarita]